MGVYSLSAVRSTSVVLWSSRSWCDGPVRHALIVERTRAGLAAARGRVGGRPTVLSDAKIATARSMYDSEDYHLSTIARTLGVSRATIYRALTPPAA